MVMTCGPDHFITGCAKNKGENGGILGKRKLPEERCEVSVPDESRGRVKDGNSLLIREGEDVRDEKEAQPAPIVEFRREEALRNGAI